MGETLNILFHAHEDGTYSVQMKESWSGRTVSGDFVPPYTTRELNTLQKKLNTLENRDQELRKIGLRLFSALSCANAVSSSSSASKKDADLSVQSVLHGVIQRTLKRRGTVALMLGFGPGCDEFVRYPWELLHNGDHFLLVSGVFTLSRVLLRPDSPVGCELPVHPPFRVLYISACPSNCVPLETERSFSAMEQALAPLIEAGQIFLDRLEPPTFSQLVRYLNSYGGASMLDDNDTIIPCYVIHFDGHGAHGRLCPVDGCSTMNEADARKCQQCGASLNRIKAQTYLCFCDDDGCNHFIDTQSLRGLLLSSDVRLAVFSACETATVTAEPYRQRTSPRAAVDATLATALVTAQVPAVVAMPFSLQDDLSPIFMYHFYEALATGRTLEEALARARQALLPMQQKSWFIPVLYRHVAEGEETPVPLLVVGDAADEYDHPLAYLGPPATFVGREQELHDLDDVLTAITSAEQKPDLARQLRRPGSHPIHHIALTGSAGIGKSTLAFEAIRRNRDKFPGGIVGVSLQEGKAFKDALLEMIQRLHIPLRNSAATDVAHRIRALQGTLRSLASRELPCLLLLDSFEEVKDRTELEAWLPFLCGLPQEVVVMVTSRSNPQNMLVMGGAHCRWYEYHVGKMNNADLLKLFTELAAESGLDQHIHLDDPQQQAILQEICTMLDGYPLGAELIFGTARTIGGRIYTPEAATRSLEEVRDELRDTPLAGILAVLEISYRRLTPLAQLLCSYLAAFNLPFTREQIVMLVSPSTLASATETITLVPPFSGQGNTNPSAVMPTTLAENWRAARDELVQASFIQFDGHVYTIHSQVSHFALAHLPIAERRRVHRVVAAYYCNLPQPSKEEWFAAFEHLETAGEPQDLHEAIRVAIRASWALNGRGSALELQAMLRRAAMHASRLGDRSGEGQIQCCLGAILRKLGQHAEAEAYLRSSLSFHRQQNEPAETAWVLYELARLCCEVGNFRQANEYAEEALLFFQEAETARGIAWVQLVLGEVNRGYDCYTASLEHLTQALHSFQFLNNKEGQAAVLYSCGMVYAALGRYGKAMSDYEEALRLFSELGMHSGRAWVLLAQSMAYLEQAQLELADHTCREASTLFQEQKIRRGEGWAFCTRGALHFQRHEYNRATEAYQEATTLLSRVGDRIGQARLFNLSGELLFAEGEYLEAKGAFEQASVIAREHGARQITIHALCGLADVARVFQQYPTAQSYYEEASAITAELGVVHEQIALLLRQGQLAEIQHQYPEALDFWYQALALDQQREYQASEQVRQAIQALSAEQHLEAVQVELAKRYSIV